MDLASKIRMTTASNTVKITTLKMDSAYPIERVEKVQTRFGKAVLLTLRESSQTYVKVFLPRRYGALFMEEDLRAINEKSVSLALRYHSNCPESNSYILELE
jgi:hypothetical protein